MTRVVGSPLNGRELVLVLLAIVLATGVVPPAAARWVNGYRVKQTETRALHAAEAIAAGGPNLATLEPSVEVACGPGLLPKADGPEQERWISHAVMAPALFGARHLPDAWGQCLLMNVGARRRGEPAWILSAGPNGRVDTPLGAIALVGDDIGVIVR